MKITSDFVNIPFREVIKGVKKGSSIVQDKNGLMPCIGPASIRKLQLRPDNLSYTSESKLPKGNIKRTTVGEIVINTIGNYRGNAALVTPEFDGMLFNRHVIALQPNTNIVIPSYLVIILNCKLILQQILSLTTGFVIPSLKIENLSDINLPIPGRETQKKILEVFNNSLNEIAILKSKIVQYENEIDQMLNDFK